MAGRTVVVTGSASGIGQATAELLRARGDRVIGVDLHDAEVIADLSTAEGCRSMAEAVGRLADGKVDAIVANAGVMGPDQPCYDVNYHGAIRTLEGLRPLLLGSAAPRAAATVSMAAGMGIGVELAEALERGAPLPADLSEGAAYSASKLALARWIRASADSPDWGRAGLPVNGLCPGVIETPMGLEALKSEATQAAVRATPFGRTAQPREMAEALAFLISPENSFMTGQIIFADGGLNAVLRPRHV
jgi:NAD(P)-dependent dehydrogenase (short-subunit alcohol dehydrogenase family)